MQIVLVGYEASSSAAKEAFGAALHQLGPSVQLSDAAYALKTRDLTVSGVKYFLMQLIGSDDDLFVLNQEFAESWLASCSDHEAAQVRWRCFVEA